uniref:Uncharacterized protein n=1 Tax=Rhizophora mucronata TaxID=61149 RepID=A0A2P2M2G9_RHIMU
MEFCYIGLPPRIIINRSSGIYVVLNLDILGLF